MSITMSSMDLSTFRAAILELIKDTNLFLSGVAIVQSPSDVLLSASLGVKDAPDAVRVWPEPSMANYEAGKRDFQRRFQIEGHPLRTVTILSFKMEDPDRLATRWQIGFRN